MNMQITGEFVALASKQDYDPYNHVGSTVLVELADTLSYPSRIIEVVQFCRDTEIDIA